MRSSPVLAAALDYAARGWPVLPVEPRGKRPILADWPRRASTDPAQVRAWFAEPDRNVGIALGHPDRNGRRLVAFDLDGAAGLDSWVALTSRHEHVPTRVHGTPSGGAHVLFTTSRDDLRNVREADELLGPGLGFCAHGRQIVAPPSRTVKGRYAVDTFGSLDAPAPLPSWLEALLARTPPEPPPAPVRPRANPSRYGAAALAGLIGEVRGAAPGGRNATLNRAAYRAGRLAAEGLLDPDHAAGALVAAATLAGLGGREAARTVRSGLRAGREAAA